MKPTSPTPHPTAPPPPPNKALDKIEGVHVVEGTASGDTGVTVVLPFIGQRSGSGGDVRCADLTTADRTKLLAAASTFATSGATNRMCSNTLLKSSLSCDLKSTNTLVIVYFVFDDSGVTAADSCGTTLPDIQKLIGELSVASALSVVLSESTVQNGRGIAERTIETVAVQFAESPEGRRGRRQTAATLSPRAS